MPPVELLVPDPDAEPRHFADCDGNGYETCWHCHGAGAFCGCADDCTPECDDPELTCPCPATCRECDGAGGFRCPGCAASDEGDDG